MTTPRPSPVAVKAAQQLVDPNVLHDNEDGTATVNLDGLIGDIAALLDALMKIANASDDVSGGQRFVSIAAAALSQASE
jgi:hypothetical protein